MKLASTAAVLAIVCSSALAHADTDRPFPAAESPSYRSENTALALSLGGTAASVAMFGIGLGTDNESLAMAGALSSFITPSLGHWYADDLLTAGMGIRAAGVGSMLIGLAESFGCWGNDEGCDTGRADTLIYLGAGAYVAGTVYDIATARSAARERNEGLRITSIAPTAIQSGAGQVTMGMGIGGTF